MIGGYSLYFKGLEIGLTVYFAQRALIMKKMFLLIAAMFYLLYFVTADAKTPQDFNAGTFREKWCLGHFGSIEECEKKLDYKFSDECVNNCDECEKREEYYNVALYDYDYYSALIDFLDPAEGNNNMWLGGYIRHKDEAYDKLKWIESSKKPLLVSAADEESYEEFQKSGEAVFCCNTQDELKNNNSVTTYLFGVNPFMLEKIFVLLMIFMPFALFLLLTIFRLKKRWNWTLFILSSVLPIIFLSTQLLRMLNLSALERYYLESLLYNTPRLLGLAYLLVIAIASIPIFKDKELRRAWIGISFIGVLSCIIIGITAYTSPPTYMLLNDTFASDVYD